MAETTTLTVNAWTGEELPPSPLSSRAAAWGLAEAGRRVPTLLRPPEEADLRNWRDPRVGWGLILPERAGLSPQELAGAGDAPEPIRALLADRAPAPVLRCRTQLTAGNRLLFLRNYATSKDVSVDRSPIGLAPDALPYYLLIYGSPTEVPWDLQYVLNSRCAVGRLDLSGDALEHYVRCLMAEWDGAQSRVGNTVVWATDHGPLDITHLMRDAIAAAVHEDLTADPDIGANARFIDGTHVSADGEDLITALAEARPGLVVTTSHGQTGPLNDAVAMRRDLGLPVDQGFRVLNTDRLLSRWAPDGAIWYAHACCSAGTDAKSAYLELFEAGSPVHRILAATSALGALTAPLPSLLLGHPKPLRAFIGQVEPTFDWTLKQPANRQHLTAPLRQALYNRLFQPDPVGYAFRDWYAGIGTLYTIWDRAVQRFNAGEDNAQTLLYLRLAARDLQSTVILGDPTVTQPPLPGAH